LRTLLVASMVLALAACSPVNTLTPIPPGPVPTTAGQAARGATAASGSASQQPQQPAAGAAPAANAGPASLQVLSPADGSVVNASTITVSGTASPGSVVTVNDDILVVGADGTFQSQVSLSEGLNLVEVIASTTSGSETSVELSVTYQP
jgi:hypothetical protein